MVQVKFYSYNPTKITEPMLCSVFSCDNLHFVKEQNVVGLSFNFSDNNLKFIAERANSLGLKPVIFTRYKFIKMIENLFNYGGKIKEVKFTNKIDEEEEKELYDILFKPQAKFDFLPFLKEILYDNNYIKSLSWYYINECIPISYSVYDSGIMYVDDGKEAVKDTDNVLQSVFVN